MLWLTCLQAVEIVTFATKKLYDYCRASRNGVPCGRVAREWLVNEVESET